MNCTHPITVKGMRMACGHCIACRISHTREWSVRLLHELTSWDKACFVTLTYRDEELPHGANLCKKDLQDFIKRLRKDYSDVKIKYFACGEYGDIGKRPHYHLIIFGLSIEDEVPIDMCWSRGYVYVGTVTKDSIQYVCGYVLKKYNGEKQKEAYGERLPCFQTCSQGLGLRWLEENRKQVLDNLGITYGGVQVGIPRYYRKKLGDELDVTAMDEARRQRREEIDIKRIERGQAPKDAGQRDVDERKQRDIDLHAKDALGPKGSL